MNLDEAKKILGVPFKNNADFIYITISQLGLKKDAKILDVGTGNGTMAIILALQGYRIITGEPEGDNWANWRSAAQKVNVEGFITFKYFNAENLPFESASFDAVFIFGTLHHIDDKYAAMKEILRVTKKKGIFVIFEHTKKGIENIRERLPSHPDAIDPKDYTENLPISLEIIESKTINAYIYKKI
jgi:ubiquinone/menaquinone biosynthesis C-methylase UbiE